MKFSKKLLSLVLTCAFAAVLAIVNPVKAEAEEYTYRVKICIGNNADAHFDGDAISELKSKYPNYTVDNSRASELVVSGLGYGRTIDVDVDSLVKIDTNNDESGKRKYYVAGLRVSGGDTIVTQTSQDAEGNRNVSASLPVGQSNEAYGDMTYVVAYGVGEVIPYTVRYVDESNNELIPEDIFYAARGEKISVPAKHKDGYQPDAYYRTASKGLKDDIVFTFVYHKYDAQTVIVDDTVYEESTTYGEPVYEYQYTNRGNNTSHGGTRNNRGGNGNTNGGANGGANGDGAAADANADAEGVDGAQAADQQGNGAGNNEEVIEYDTPLDIIDIDEEEIAKAANPVTPMVRNMIIGIIIAVIALLAIATALLIAAKKRRNVIAQNRNEE